MDNSKEGMLDTVKTLQEKVDNIEKLLDKGDDVIVLQLGSDSTYFGSSTQTEPYSIKTVLACRNKSMEEEKDSSKSLGKTKINSNQLEKVSSSIEESLRLHNILKSDSKANKTKSKTKVEHDLRKEFLPDDQESETNDEFYFAEEALEIANKYPDQYSLSYPIKYGYIDNSKSLFCSLTEIQKILEWGFCKFMGLQSSDFQNYNLVLVVPVDFCRYHTKALIDMFFRDFDFKSVYLHLDSILACFACCLTSACVVDIGHTSIRVSCIEEGLVIPKSIVRKNYGVKDLELIFMRLAIGKYKSIGCKKENSSDIQTNSWKKIDNLENEEIEAIESELVSSNFLQSIKSSSWAFKQEDDLIQRVFFGNMWLNGEKMSFYINQSDAFYISPNSLFYSEMLETIDKSSEKKSFESFISDFEKEDYEDCLDETNLEDMTTKGSVNKEPREMDEEDLEILNKLKPSMSDPWIPENLETIICYSITLLRDPESRKKFANNILVTGAFSQLPEFLSELEERVIDKFSEFDPNVERVEAIDLKSKEISSAHCSWLGGAILPKLESIEDLWVSKDKWQASIPSKQLIVNDNGEEKIVIESGDDFGLRALKERLAFQW